MLSDQAWMEIARSFGLSRRQSQIVRGVFEDSTEYSISQDLGISSHTVHTHLERIHKKLGVHDRVALVLLVLSEFIRLTTDLRSGLPPLCGRRHAGLCPLQGSRSGN